MPEFDVPMFKIELIHLKQTLLHSVETRQGELKEAIDKGIDLAYLTLPHIVAERCRAAVINAVAEATCEALKEYFSSGGAGYEQVMAHVVATLGKGIEPDKS